MKLNKYSKHKGVTYATYGTSSSSSGYGNHTDTGNTGGSGDLDRWIWGNKDDGGDIDETMFVAGSVYVLKESLLDPDDDDDDGKDGGDPDYQPYPDDDGGNIYAEGEIQAPEMYATKTLYIPHPDTKVKTDIIELFKDCVIEAEAIAEEPLYLDTTVENNKLTINGSVDTYSKSEIDNMISIIGSGTLILIYDGIVTGLQTTRWGGAITNYIDIVWLSTNKVFAARVLEGSTMSYYLQWADDGIHRSSVYYMSLDGDVFTPYRDRIYICNNKMYMWDGDELYEVLNEEEENNEINILKYGDYLNPVILASGNIYIINGTTTWAWNGARKDKITNMNISVTGGLMKVVITAESSMLITSCSVSLQHSGETDGGSSVTSISGRSNGAHWFETFWEDNTLYIREFHQSNDNNDSWTSNGWNLNNGVDSVNVIITGYFV